MEKFISIIIWLFASLIAMTWLIRVESPSGVDIFDAGAKPVVYCFWHETLLVVAYLFRNSGKTAIVSRSKDGRIAANVAKMWKHEIVYGSAHRGGAAALRQSVRALRNGRSLGITPDGPKGPRRVAKIGAAQIAMMDSTPIVTISVNAKKTWRLKSWDKFMIPHPFAKITVTLSEPIIPTAPENNDIDNAATLLTKKIEESFA